VALAMVPLAVASVGVAGLSAAYFGGGRLEPWTLLAAGVIAVLLALIVASRTARQLSQLLAADAERQQAAHQALAASEQNAQAIIKTALDAFFQTDLDGVIVEWGPQAEALTGWTRTEAIGVNVVDLMVPHRMRDAHRERRRKMLDDELGASAGVRFEARAMHRDGREFPV
jgi:PAS domain S-box-containing protein